MADDGKVVYKVEVDDSDVESQVQSATNKIQSGFETTTKKADLAGNLIASGYAAKISQSIISAGTGLVGFGLTFVQQMESYTTNFTTMLGSADKAATLVNDLKEMAAKTPFGTSDLADATQTLMAFGVEADEVIDTMTMLGDVSLGNKQRFSQLALAFGQVQSAGKLSGQDLLQFINAGMNPLNEISKKTGESMAELKTRMSEGGVSAEEVAEAFKSATSEGGQFYEAMNAASETTAGRISTLKDNAAELAGTMVSALLPILQLIIEALSNAVEWLTQHQTLAKALGIIILTVVGVLGTLSAVFSVATGAAAIFGTTVGAVFAPITIIIAAIGALVAIGVVLATHWEDIKAKCSEIWNSITNFFKSVVDKIKGMWQALIDWFKGIPGWFRDIGKSIVDGIWNGIKSGWDWLVNSVKNLAGDLWQGVKDFLGIHSPSKKFAYLGKMSGVGYAEGFSDEMTSAQQIVEQRTGELLETAKLSVTADKIPETITNTLSGSLKAESAGTPIVVPVSIDGREVARASAWYMGEQLAWEER